MLSNGRAFQPCSATQGDFSKMPPKVSTKLA